MPMSDPDQRIVLRIGINLGDVIIDGDDLYGDGVNIAARLQSMAEPGEIWLSRQVHDQVETKLDVAFDDLGLKELKNIARPVQVFRIAGTRQEAGPPAPADTKRPSVAILPFANMSGDPEQRYFSDGITEDIITELSRFRQLKVVARNSSFRYRDLDVDIRRVGRELGVSYVVEGSVRRLGKRIRITAQLIDGATGSHLWAERFDRDESEIFAVQDQLVRTIVATLVGRLQAAGAEGARRKPPTSLAAYECVLKADALPFGDPAAEAEAMALYEQAVKLDPSYARAYALLANLLRMKWDYGAGGEPAVLARAFELARKAVALDENDGMCHGILGLVHLARYDHDLAEHHYQKALSLNANSATLLASMGSLYTYLGRPEEALDLFREARIIDPFYNPSWYWSAVGAAHLMTRQYRCGRCRTQPRGHDALLGSRLSRRRPCPCRPAGPRPAPRGRGPAPVSCLFRLPPRRRRALQAAQRPRASDVGPATGGPAGLSDSHQEQHDTPSPRSVEPGRNRARRRHRPRPWRPERGRLVRDHRPCRA